MFFIEVFIPKGALDPERRRLLMQRLGSIDELLLGEPMHPEAERTMRSCYQAVLHEQEIWTVGGDLWSEGDPPRYVVRLQVPGSWRKEMAEHLIPIFLRVIGEIDGDPEGVAWEPRALVNVVGVPEGSVGVFGGPMRSEDLGLRIGRSFREVRRRGETEPGPRPGAVYDPMCGMTIELATAEFTLEHGGEVYGFCCDPCRTAFRKELEEAPAG
ncbi:YHS domain-containing protein [Nocardiopsis potens]|uniref:YHS domain-containing protein n=1 Tax=Nocardiopsis potens TaxID=1246458 RepID=UPI00034D8D8B|nr:YHS domain-containing protein [Nocardiopsis potens]